MRSCIVLLAAAVQIVHASPIVKEQQPLQIPAWKDEAAPPEAARRKLQGRFLHITDLHADPFYKIHASTEEDDACHRGSGSAGTYGAETSDCDSPYSLINQTFNWIENNLRDTVDFVVWTGDSARHDNDEKIPRSPTQVLGINEYVAGKFAEVFGTGKPDEGGNEDLTIPIVPNFGNNDILPHNIMLPGPNKWLKNYNSVWQMFIPEEQRHGFERGGWFYVEVIPMKLAVFSLNTLYFFDSNSAVDGCALRSEPGFEQMEWLRIQLGFIRQRGMKAILMGHVPPARTDSKQLWDETCWQKYTLWLKQYRDVVITGLFGHMNVDHFILQDTKDIDLVTLGAEASTRTQLDDDLTIESATDYLEELRLHWAKLPKIPSVAEMPDDINDSKKKNKKKKKSKKDNALKKIGGQWGERYQLSSISPSVVPNFFPTLRVIEYNITGLDDAVTWFNRASVAESSSSVDFTDTVSDTFAKDLEVMPEEYEEEAEIHDDDTSTEKKKKKKKKKPKKPKKPKNPDLTIPPAPSKGTPPGPAYSPQTLTLLGYTQYFANLTNINNDYNHDEDDEDVENSGWHNGKHKNRAPKGDKPHPKKLIFEVEYSTFNDTMFRLKDMTVKSYLKLARRIGKHDGNQNSIETSNKLDGFEVTHDVAHGPTLSLSSLAEGFFNLVKYCSDLFNQGNVAEQYEIIQPSAGWEIATEKKHKKKEHHKKNTNKTWIAFLKRAFVGTMTNEELKEFQIAREQAALARDAVAEEL